MRWKKWSNKTHRVSRPGGNRLLLRVPISSSTEQRHRWMNVWSKAELRKLAGPRLASWSGRVGVHPETWGIRKMRTKWGSCNPQKGIVWLEPRTLEEAGADDRLRHPPRTCPPRLAPTRRAFPCSSRSVYAPLETSTAGAQRAAHTCLGRFVIQPIKLVCSRGCGWKRVSLHLSPRRAQLNTITNSFQRFRPGDTGPAGKGPFALPR